MNLNEYKRVSEVADLIKNLSQKVQAGSDLLSEGANWLDRLAEEVMSQADAQRAEAVWSESTDQPNTAPTPKFQFNTGDEYMDKRINDMAESMFNSYKSRKDTAGMGEEDLAKKVKESLEKILGNWINGPKPGGSE